MRYICPQCLDYAAREKYGEGDLALSKREREEWGRGHFQCNIPTVQEIKAHWETFWAETATSPRPQGRTAAEEAASNGSIAEMENF